MPFDLFRNIAKYQQAVTYWKYRERTSSQDYIVASNEEAQVTPLGPFEQSKKPDKLSPAEDAFSAVGYDANGFDILRQDICITKRKGGKVICNVNLPKEHQSQLKAQSERFASCFVGIEDTVFEAVKHHLTQESSAIFKIFLEQELANVECKEKIRTLLDAAVSTDDMIQPLISSALEINLDIEAQKASVRAKSIFNGVKVQVPTYSRANVASYRFKTFNLTHVAKVELADSSSAIDKQDSVMFWSGSRTFDVSDEFHSKEMKLLQRLIEYEVNYT